MKQLELHWKWETTVKWSSLMSVVGRLSKPVDCIKHLGYDCVLRSRMDLSLDGSPAVTYLEKSWEEVIILIIFFHLSCIILVLCFPYNVMQYLERTATNSSHQTLAPELWWSPSVWPHKFSLILALSGSFLVFFSFWTTICLFFLLFGDI